MKKASLILLSYDGDFRPGRFIYFVGLVYYWNGLKRAISYRLFFSTIIHTTSSLAPQRVRSLPVFHGPRTPQYNDEGQVGRGRGGVQAPKNWVNHSN